MPSTRTAKRMTFKEAVKECAQLGFTLIHDREWGEFIVKPRGALKDDARNHHTGGTSPEDLEDAVNTCRAMSKERSSSRRRAQVPQQPQGRRASWRRAAELSPTPPPLQQGENADNPEQGSPFFQWLDQWHTQLQEKYPSIKNSVYKVIQNSNYDMNNADKELAKDAQVAERQQQNQQQRQQKMPSRSTPAQQAPAQQAPAQQAPAQQALYQRAKQSQTPGYKPSPRPFEQQPPRGASRKQKSNQSRSKGTTPMANRRAKLDIMTGFSGIEKIDGDQGSKGSGYFPKWTTVGLPDQGRNDALDDDQQKTGSGAPETSFPGAPLKVPMEAEDVKRPKIREGREATKSQKLRKVASEIRLLDPVLSRRLMAAADELAYDDLSTAALPVSGDEPNEVDDHQDGGGHGTLAFFGTDTAKSTSLTRKSSRRVQANPCEVKKTSEGYILVDDSGKKVGGPFESEHKARKEQIHLIEREEKEDEGRESTLEYASRNRSSSRRRATPNKNSQDPDIDLDDAVNMVKRALKLGDPQYKSSVRTIWDKESKRVDALLQEGGSTTPQQAAAPHVATGDKAASRKARAQGDAPLKPIAAPPDEDGPGAGGAGGFAHKSKAPLQKSMNADDVERPRIRENPEASKSLWAAFKHMVTKRGDVGGTWNDGRYTISSRDYGNTLEVSASVKDREGIHMPVGSMTISLVNDSPSGRFASVELNDGLVENRVLEFTMRPKMASKVASWIFQEASDISKETLEHVGVS
jgi:hypothetical protein